MKNGLKASVIGLMAVSLLAGCGSNSSQSSTSSEPKTKISTKTMRKYYETSVNNYADILNRYSDYVETNTNHIDHAVDKQVTYLNNVNKELAENSINKKKSRDLIKFNEVFIGLAKSYKTFNKKDNYKYNSQAGKMASKIRNEIGATKENKKVEKAGKRQTALMEKQPHIDKKNMTVITSNAKIQFTSAQIVPGFEGEKTVLVNYTVTNLSNSPQEPFKLLSDAGEFEQDDGNNYREIETGEVDTDWEEAHPDYEKKENDSAEVKVKENSSLQTCEVFELANTDKPLLLRAKDEATNTNLGTLKIPLNYNNQ